MLSTLGGENKRVETTPRSSTRKHRKPVILVAGEIAEQGEVLGSCDQ